MKLDTNLDRLTKYWRKGHQFDGYKWHHYATNLLLDEIDLENKRVLDVGCGHGDSIRYFLSRKAITSGIDISREAVDYCKNIGYDVIKGDTRNIPFPDNTFDIVFSLGVVEHFDETEKAIREHKRVCKEGGLVIIIVPNYTWTYLIALTIYYLTYPNYNLMTTMGKCYLKNDFEIILNKCRLRNHKIRAYGLCTVFKYLPLIKPLAWLVENTDYNFRKGHFLCSISTK